MPHQHKYDNEHTDTTHPSTKYHNEWANTSARYTTNMPSPAQTRRPCKCKQIKRQWHTTSTSPMSMMNRHESHNPGTEYHNEQANTSAGYTTNTPSPTRTQHPHEREQIK